MKYEVKKNDIISMYVKTKQKVSKYESTSTYKIIMKGK